MYYEDNRVKDLKVAYIGGGSRGWAWGFMMDLAADAQMEGTVALYDIDHEAAEHNEIIGNKYKVCSYTGTMSQAAREQQKHQFINDPNCRILIGTYQALGTSHTLVAANNVFFYDEAWVPTTMQQAEDRVHRPGQTNTVNLYRLITKDTIDEHVHKILYKKKGISSYIVDNIDIRSNPELFDLLLSH